MKASEAKFRYPVLGFTPSKDYGEFGWQFRDLDSLTVDSAQGAQSRAPIPPELIDANGQRWTVKSWRKVGRYGALFPWLLGGASGWNRYRGDYDLEPLPAVTLEQVQDRVCAVLTVFGEADDYTPEHEAETAALLAKIRKATSISRIAKLADWDGF